MHATDPPKPSTAPRAGCGPSDRQASGGIVHLVDQVRRVDPSDDSALGAIVHPMQTGPRDTASSGMGSAATGRASRAGLLKRVQGLAGGSPERVSPPLRRPWPLPPPR
jgi:hypothetical protein